MTELHPLLARLAEAGAFTPPSRPQRTPNGAGTVTTLPGPGDPQATRYAATALDREAGIVAGTPEGRRNDQLNTSSFRVGQLVGCGWLAEQAAADTLIDAGMASGLSYAESERTVTSGLDAGQRAPRAGVELHTPTPAAYVVTDAPEAGEVTLGGGQDSGGSHDVVADAGEPATASLADDPLTQALARAVTGAPWVHDTPAQVPALWGEGDDVLWAEGEPTIITGPTGVGKTTLGTQLVAGRMGLIPSVLGYPVRPGRRVLVLAMDRPQQIRRAMARTLRNHPADILDERLVVLPGPPPVDVARRPGILLWLAQQFDADTVVLDSLKDAAVKLSDEETGQGLSRAMNMCVANGVDILAYHHQRKHTNSGQGKPNSLADVYGSSWITAGAGSVILLWGNAGDLVIELSHLKQPAGDVGPLSIGHDHTAGHSFLYEDGAGRGTLLDLLASGPQTASTVASWLYGDAADRAAVAKARRRLDKLVEQGQAARLDDKPTKGGFGGGGSGSRYVIASSQKLDARVDARNGLSTHEKIGHPQVGSDARLFEVSTHDSRRTLDARDARNSKNPQVSVDARSMHAETAPSMHAPKPPFRGGVGGVRVREGDSTSWESNDVEVCAKCYKEADHFVPAPHGRRWCRECAYPTENPTEFEDEER